MFVHPVNTGVLPFHLAVVTKPISRRLDLSGDEFLANLGGHAVIGVMSKLLKGNEACPQQTFTRQLPQGQSLGVTLLRRDVDHCRGVWPHRRGGDDWYAHLPVSYSYPTD